MSADFNYKNIEDYGIIGDLHTVALVGCDGSIDFMCFPRFDYARARHRVECQDDGALFISEGDDQTRLRSRTSVPREIKV